MFRGKIFEPTLVGVSYRIFIEGLKSAVTKAAYTYALQKYMKHLRVKGSRCLVVRRQQKDAAQLPFAVMTDGDNKTSLSR